MQKILLIGSSGLVGSRFVELYGDKYKTLTPSHEDLDIRSNKSVKEYLSDYKPEFIINFAAYTNVSEAEKQKGDKSSQCWKINVEGVRNILDAIDPEKTDFVQFSTDMVMYADADDPGPYSEDHPAGKDPDKNTWYGYTKGEAERLVLEKLGDKATILRIIYPVRAKFDQKLDYLRKPLQLYDQGKLHPLFTDQQISITFIDEACEALRRIIEGKFHGVFHAGSRDITTPYEIISYLLERARGAKEVVRSSSLHDFIRAGNSPVRYPEYGGLKVEATEKELGMKFSTSREIVDELVEQGLS